MSAAGKGGEGGEERWRLWLHAIGRSPEPPAVDGIGGAAVTAVRAAGLCAYASPAGPENAGAEALRAHLADPEWVGPAAFEHHRVVAAAAATGPVVPAALATVYRDEASLAAALERHRAALDTALEKVAGRAEWGVKGYVRTDAPAARNAPAAGPGAGVAYLDRRRAELAARDRRQEDAAEAGAAAHERLSTAAVAAWAHPPHDRRVSGASEPMVLNGTYLVDDDRAAEFGRAVDALAVRHGTLRLELTGPWPPYSFVPSLTAAAGWPS